MFVPPLLGAPNQTTLSIFGNFSPTPARLGTRRCVLFLGFQNMVTLVIQYMDNNRPGQDENCQLT